MPLDDNRWLLHVRAAEGDSPDNASFMRQALSEDGGVTWSDYERWYDDTLTQSAINFIWSMDEGQTWSEMISIVEPQLAEIGYPSILELDDGRADRLLRRWNHDRRDHLRRRAAVARTQLSHDGVRNGLLGGRHDRYDQAS